MIRFTLVATNCLLLLIPTTRVAGQTVYIPTYSSASRGATASPGGEGSHASRVRAALSVAKQAANSGHLDVSFEAVRRAVGNGPPLAVSGLGGLLGSQQQQMSPFGSSNRSPVVDPQQLELARSLAAVNAVWVANQASPKECFAIWKDVIFPPNRPAEAFSYCASPPVTGSSYSVSLAAAEPEPLDESGTAALAYWAWKAGEVSKLDALLTKRESQPSAKSVVAVVRLRLALLDKSNDGIQLCERLASSTSPLISGRDSAELMFVATRLLDKIPTDAKPRHELLGALAASVGGTQSWQNNRWLKYVLTKAANDALKTGNRSQFDRYSNALLTSLDPLRSGNEDYVRDMTARMYAAASNQAFSSGQLDLGIQCLRDQVRLSAGIVRSNDSSKGLVDVVAPSFRTLLGMETQQRYDILKELPWELPMLGLSSVAAYAPKEKIPQRFVDNYKSYHKVAKLPIENVFQGGSECLSVLEWTMRDAIALGVQDEITNRIVKLEQSGSDDAPLARAVWAKAQNLPIDVSTLIVGDGEKKSLRPEVVGTRGSLVPLDLDIINAALQDPATFDLGLDLASRFEARGKASYTNEVLYGRFLVAKARLASASPPATSDALKHFVRADEYRGRTLSLGLPRESLWLENDNGDWQHHACTFRSSLLLKYPLAGDYKISFTCTDETYAECAATAHGVTMDYRGYAGNVAAAIVGQRSQFSIPSTAITRGEKMAIELLRNSQTETLVLRCNDSEVATFKVAGGEFPFVGPHSMMHRKMALEGFRIEGDVRIPRSIELLTPRLVGWSSLFHSRLLPQVEGYIVSGGDEETDSTRYKAKVVDIPEGATVVNYEWHMQDGVLASVNHAARVAADKKRGIESKSRNNRDREEWIYYIRPLCDGEEVKYEFYQEKAAFSVHPTIDRIAVRLEETIREHWITNDPKLYGVSSTNRRDVPSSQVLGKVNLHNKQWNTAALQRNGDWITLSINGQKIYKQKVTTGSGGRFGFMAEPKAFHTRVHSVTLSGNWPVELPADIFAKR